MNPMPKRQFLKWTLAATATTALVACGGGDDEPSTPDIVGVALTNPQFSILVEAVVAAGLVETLKGPGPFTVFAPTNAAFAALLTELGVTKEALLANKQQCSPTTWWAPRCRLPVCPLAKPSPPCKAASSRSRPPAA